VCVFCGASSDTAKLEAAHVLPVEEKDLLSEPKNRALYGIESVNDGANGITLCWGRHKCFDANLVCIDPGTNKLLVTDALMANEDKWERLADLEVSPGSPTWPNAALLQFRVHAMQEATDKRREKQNKCILFCTRCSKGYMRTHALEYHEKTCGRLTASAYHTPASKGAAEEHEPIVAYS
jgi:hypothetical protein